MKAIVVGCGRVGSALAKRLHSAGWEVAAVDESEEALERLGEKWPGELHIGHGMDTDLLEAAGIASADLVIVATDGDNTNVVVAQIAKARYDVPKVAVRVHDPARATFYANRGFEVVSPTTMAIDALAAIALDGGDA
jgi:trk system potassium uptake protein TrkA